MMKLSEERLQDFLMPGLRHAHTLQQLKEINEYSPPGEYLINLQLVHLGNKLIIRKLNNLRQMNKLS